METDRSVICICGHSLGSHEMLGTEYARCQPSTGVRCYCSGGERGVVRLLDVRTSGRGAAWTGGLRAMCKGIRVYQDGRYVSALESGLRALKDKGLNYVWLEKECDRCGCEFLASSDVHVRMVGPKGEFLLRLSRGDDYTGRYGLLCGRCEFEMRYVDGK